MNKTNRYQFHLLDLFILMTMTAVLLGVALVSPSFAVAGVLVGVVALAVVLEWGIWLFLFPNSPFCVEKSFSLRALGCLVGAACGVVVYYVVGSRLKFDAGIEWALARWCLGLWTVIGGIAGYLFPTVVLRIPL